MEKSECRTEIVVSRDKAVFWMDANGRWHNRHGPFEHPNIIRYFNASIQKDEGGYFVSQRNQNVIEKVYFPYVITAYFVVAVEIGDSIKAKLNTQRELDLLPERLLMCQEDLYYRMENDIAKFSFQALLNISQHITYDGKKYHFTIGAEPQLIVETKSLEPYLPPGECSNMN